MATISQAPLAPDAGSERFFLRAAIVMTVTIVTAFSFQFWMGRSTLASPLRVHLHAFFFMGWVAIYLLQNIFVATDRMYLHRRLGWIAAAWMVPMIVMGFVVTLSMVRLAHVPFFFRPLQFLIFDPLSLLGFVGLTTSAIVLRKQTEWHRRLHFCGMTLLLGPAFGRLLPMPLLQPYAWETALAASFLFPIVGAVSDVRRSGRVHPAWYWGMAGILGTAVVIEAITYSPVGLSIYRAVTEGSPGANVGPLDFGSPPPGMLVTGR